MIHYLKADIYRIQQEKKLLISLGILVLLSLLSAFLFKDSPSADNTVSLIQLLTQFIMLFFIVPTNILFGEDFAHRTINNILIKQKRRQKFFSYKVLTTILLNLFYVALSYLISAGFRVLMGGQVDLQVFGVAFLHQIPLLIAISILCDFLFIIMNRVGQAYLAYILIALLFDNVCRLILSNILHLDFPVDYFIFLSLQNGAEIPPTTMVLSLIQSLLLLGGSYYVFNEKELK